MSEETPPVIFTDPSQSEATVQILHSMASLESKLEVMPPVKDEEGAALVSEYRAQFTKQAKELDKERLSMTAGARETVTRMNQKYNVHIERAKRMTSLADNLLLPYMREQKRIREEAERVERERKQAEEEAKRKEEQAIADAQRIAKETADAEALKEAEAKVTEAKAGLNEVSTRRTPLAPKKSISGVLGSSTGIREIWKYRVIDISKVPEEYLVDPEDRIKKGELNKIAKKDKANAFVPGIEFFYEDSLTSSGATKI